MADSGGDLLATRAVLPVPPNPGEGIPATFVTADARGFITNSSPEILLFAI